MVPGHSMLWKLRDVLGEMEENIISLAKDEYCKKNIAIDENLLRWVCVKSNWFTWPSNVNVI